MVFATTVGDHHSKDKVLLHFSSLECSMPYAIRLVGLHTVCALILAGFILQQKQH